MSATLGGYIKDLRLQKNISQLEIAFALGWKEPSRLSRIEQGRVGKPKRKLLDKIMDTMNLKVEERNHLLLVGNYIPTEEEVGFMAGLVKEELTKWKFPVVIFGFTWRLIKANPAGK